MRLLYKRSIAVLGALTGALIIGGFFSAKQSKGRERTYSKPEVIAAKRRTAEERLSLVRELEQRVPTDHGSMERT